MHELSIAQGIAEVVLRNAADNNVKRVVRIEIEVGELSLISLDQLEFWLETCFEGTIAGDAEVIFRKVEPLVKCEECGYEGDIDWDEDPQMHLIIPVLGCPKCGSNRIAITQGRDCVVRKIEVEV